MIEGRGLFFGAAGRFGAARIFNQATWDQACRQSAEWGIQWVHPKVADDKYWWYHGGDATQPDMGQLAMLRDVAHHYGLRIAPYHYCWGPARGHADQEAQIAGAIANFFDGCCPDMEVEWNNQGPLAVRFGQILRQVSPHGLVVPTLFANPNQHPTPYVEINRWADGWMPMVYFAEWTTAGHQDSAQNAIDFLYEPQWLPLAQHIAQLGGVPKPILPLIEVGDNLPPQEVYNWLVKMGHYGYCGFWYDGTYGPYANTVKSAPVPAFPRPQPQPHPTPQPEPVPEIFVPAIPEGPGLTVEKGDPQMNQHLTSQQLAVIWHMGPGPTDALDMTHGIPKTWSYIMQNRPDLSFFFGPPTTKETPFSIGGVSCNYTDFTGGGRIIAFSDGTIALCAAPHASTSVRESLPSQPTLVEVPAVTPPSVPVVGVVQ